MPKLGSDQREPWVEFSGRNQQRENDDQYEYLTTKNRIRNLLTRVVRYAFFLQTGARSPSKIRVLICTELCVRPEKAGTVGVAQTR